MTFYMVLSLSISLNLKLAPVLFATPKGNLLHQYEISALVSQMSFRGETGSGFERRLFSQASIKKRSTKYFLDCGIKLLKLSTSSSLIL